jgi:hypothetical protein
MIRPAMTPSATALLRAMLARCPASADRILLSNWCSVDWQSLTFAGERHQIGFVVRGDGALDLARRWTNDLADAELAIGRGRFVAEVAVCGAPVVGEDGSVLIEIEALTLLE